MTKTRLGMAMALGLWALGCDGGTGDGASGLNDPPMDPGAGDAGMEAPQPVCGNGVVEAGEVCDGTVPAESSCASFGFDGGTVSCSLDCLEVRVDNCTVAPRTLTVMSTAAVTDNGYDGTIASMTCLDFVVPDNAKGLVEETGFAVTLAMDHSFVGDLVVKLVAPSGHVGTLLHRPGIYAGPDDGTGAGGTTSNLDSAYPITLQRGIGGFKSDSVGKNLTTSQAVCRDDGYCKFVAEADAGPFELEHEHVGGTWRVCIGDAAGGDTGTVKSATLTLSPTVNGLPEVEGGEPLVTAIPDGTFDGTVASMVCRAYDFSGLDTELTTHDLRAAFQIQHPNVGDLVFALVDADGELHSLGVRAGVDEDASGHGAGPGVVANLVSTDRLWFQVGPYAGAEPEPFETHGLELATDAAYCPGECHVRATSGALPWLAADETIGTPSKGKYKLCVGDAVPGNAGTFTYGILSIGFDP